MKKRLSKASLFSSLAIFTLLSTVVASFAWFVNSITLRNLDIDGDSAPAYFAYGDGLPYEEDAQGKIIHQPFGISNTRHLSNLSWLLYSGNSLVTGNKYFEIDTSTLTNNTLDCSTLTIPPIGTESNPFLGHFDGNDAIIEGLTITNDATKFTNKPNNITYNQLNAEIVGFFGVVGNLNNAYSGTYNSSINSLTDFTLKDITVESVTANTLIGLAAGYVDADMENVKVDGEVTLDVDDQEHTAKTSITDKISDYGLVGYSTKTGRGGSSYSQKLSKYYSNGEESGGGQGDDWGGSIDMKSLNHRFYNIINNIGLTYRNPNSTSYRRHGYYQTDESKYSFSHANGMSTYSTSPDNAFIAYMLMGDGVHTDNNSTDTRYNFDMPGTVVPLAINDDYSTSLDNTGYIISNTRKTSSKLYTDASVRSASYAIRHIGNSISDVALSNTDAFPNGSGVSVSYTRSNVEILTNKNASYNSSGSSSDNFVLIKDELAGYNQNHTVTNSYLTSFTKDDSTTPTSLNLEKYNKARMTLDDILDGATFVHGIHFMADDILYDKTISLKTAKINGKVYSNYSFPKSCIDFHLKENGRINFFGGSYYNVSAAVGSKSDCFFSLHSIERENNDLVSSSIKTIEKIYKNNAFDSSDSESKKYIYLYADGTYSGSASDLGDNVFDMDYLASTPPVQNAVYYFEIPVNAGEYALGGVSGQDGGGYLMYLDIGASAAEPTDTLTAHSITTKNAGNAYPIGVDFVPISVTGDGGETIAISIASGEQGSLIIAIDTDTKDISVTDTSSIANYAYKSSNCVDSDPTNNQFTCDLPGAPPTPSGGGVRILNIGLKKTNGNTYSIRITDILSDDNGTIGSSTFELNSGSGFVSSTQSTIEGLSTEINLTNLRGLETAAILSRASGTREFVTTYDTANCSDANKIVDVDIDKKGTTISISVTAGYTFKIGGESKSTGDTY